jgi:hypothetical protein
LATTRLSCFLDMPGQSHLMDMSIRGPMMSNSRSLLLRDVVSSRPFSKKLAILTWPCYTFPIQLGQFPSSWDWRRIWPERGQFR